MKKAAIIGYGRFGELLAGLASTKFDLRIVEFNPARIKDAHDNGLRVAAFKSVTECDFIFLAVPISEIEPTLLQLSPLLDERHTVMDLCSVKVYPTQLMRKQLAECQILGMHPMFGPDSAKKGLEGLQVAICPIRIKPEDLKIIKDFWFDYGLDVIETSPDEHDKDAVYSQAFTYSLARIILNMKLPAVGFKTRSFSALTEVAALSANDSEQLFHDMLYYNPYFSQMKSELEAAIARTVATLDRIEAEK